MSLLSEVKQVVEECDILVETGVFSAVPPDTYAVLTPLADAFDLHADNKPTMDVQEVRLSLFCKENYLKTKNTIVHVLLASDITVTDRRYIGHEDDTGYHHYAIDVAKSYVWED